MRFKQRRGRVLLKRRRSRVFKRRYNGRRMERKIRRVLRNTAETKWVDQSAAGGVSSTYQSIVINDPAQGTTRNQRVGDRIRRKNLRLKFHWTYGDAFNAIRLTIVQWNDRSSISVPVGSDIYENIGFPIVTPLNRVNLQQKMMVPMYDKTFFMDDKQILQREMNLNFYGKRLPGKNLTFLAGGSTTSSKIYVFLWCDSIAAPNPSYQMYARMTFVDV